MKIRVGECVRVEEVKDGPTEATRLSAVLTVGTRRILVAHRVYAYWEGWSACMHGDWVFFPKGKLLKIPHTSFSILFGSLNNRPVFLS